MPENVEPFSKPYSSREIHSEITDGLQEYTEQHKSNIEEVLAKLRANTATSNERTPDLVRTPEVDPTHIEDEVWQKQMNEAFEKGDYERATILHKVRPELSPDDEIVKNSLRKIMSSLPNNWMYVIHTIKSISSVMLSGEQNIDILLKICNVCIKDPYSKMLEKYKDVYGSFPAEPIKQFVFSYMSDKSAADVGQYLHSFIQETGIVFTSQDIIYLSAQFTSDVLVEWLRKLKIVIPIEEVDAVYEALYKQNQRLDKQLIEYTGKLPSPELVRRMILDRLLGERIPWNYVKKIVAEYELPTIQIEEVKNAYERELIDYIYLNRKEFPMKELLGIQPTQDIVETLLSKILRNPSASVNDMQTQLNRLKEVGLYEFTMFQEVVQSIYSKCILEGNPALLITLFENTSVRPIVETHVVKAFYVRLIGLYDSKIIHKVADICSVPMAFSSGEQMLMYDEIAETGDCTKLEHLAALNDEIIPRAYVEKCAHVLLQRFLNMSMATRQYGMNEIAKNFISKHGITFSSEDINDSYRRCIESGDTWITLKELYNLFGEFPIGQLNSYYRKIYNDFIQNGKVYQIVDTLVTVHQLLESTIPYSENEMKHILTSVMVELGYSVESYRRIEAVYAGKINWSYEEVKLITVKIIRNGALSKLALLPEITGINLEDDTYLRNAYQERLSTEINKIISDKTSDTADVLRAIAHIKQISEIIPELSQMQEAYNMILQHRQNWSTLIESFIQSSGIEPTFTEEQLNEKAAFELAEGQVGSLDLLKKYGNVELSEDQVQIAYEHILQNGLSPNVIKQIKEKTGVNPTVDQLANILTILVKPSTTVRDVWSSMIETYGYQSGMGKKALFLFLTNGNYKAVKELFEMNVVALSSTEPFVQSIITNLVQREDVSQLKEIKKIFQGQTLPCDRDVLNNIYKKHASQGVTEQSIDTMKFFADVTGMRPDFEDAELQSLHLEALNRGTSKLFCDLTKTQPSSDTYIKAYTQFLGGATAIHVFDDINKHVQKDDDLKEKLIITRFQFYVQTFKYGISDLSYLESITDPKRTELLTFMEKEMIAAFDTYVPHKYSAHEIVVLLQKMEERLGRRVNLPTDVIDRFVRKELIFVLDYQINDSLGFNKEYFEKLWSFIATHYSVPSYNEIAKTYLSVLETDEPYKQAGTISRPINLSACTSLEYVNKYFSTIPNKDYLIQLAVSTRGVYRHEGCKRKNTG